MKVLIVMLMFNGVWAGSVIGAGSGYLWFGPLAALAFLILYVSFLAERPRQEMLFAGTALVVGGLLDSLAGFAGAVTYPHPAWNTSVSAPFMLALWPAFSLMLIRVMKWMRGKYLLGAIFGVFGGPFAYWSGDKLGAIQLSESLGFSLSVIAVEWAIAMIILLKLWDVFLPVIDTAELTDSAPDGSASVGSASGGSASGGSKTDQPSLEYI